MAQSRMVTALLLQRLAVWQGLVVLVASAVISVTVANAAPGLDALYAPYKNILQQHLREKSLPGGGLVSAFDYQAAVDNPHTKKLLQRQRKALADFNLDRLEGKYEAIAFWLNAYNFFMIAHILEERPGGELVNSVWDYGGRYNPFQDNIFQRRLFTVGGRRYSLDQIEKDILLGDEYRQKGWKEARVHFAVNCAAVGCPPLRAEPYTANNVDALLTENTHRALNTECHMHIEDDKLHLSEIFDWYQQDFIQEAGSVRGFLKRYTDKKRHRQIDNARRIRYIEYDWSLNRPENIPAFR